MVAQDSLFPARVTLLEPRAGGRSAEATTSFVALRPLQPANWSFFVFSFFKAD
jgi:hypothetical protein